MGSVSYVTDSRSYFARLDFGPEGELFAYMPLTGQVQVFSVSGGPGVSAAPAPASAKRSKPAKDAKPPSG